MTEYKTMADNLQKALSEQSEVLDKMTDGHDFY